jgi:hypothetical protein
MRGMGGEFRSAGEQMTEIVSFQALAFDLVDGRLVDGQLVNCGSPALAIQTAQGQWKVFGHAGAVAYSRTSHFGKGKFGQKHVLRRFGQVPEAYLRENIDE